jgi:hypothetical protein
VFRSLMFTTPSKTTTKKKIDGDWRIVIDHLHLRVYRRARWDTFVCSCSLVQTILCSNLLCSYHAHHGMQRSDGLFGALIVHQKTTPNLHTLLCDKEYVMTIDDFGDLTTIAMYWERVFPGAAERGEQRRAEKINKYFDLVPFFAHQFFLSNFPYPRNLSQRILRNAGML